MLRGLTQREADVARLAAERKTNAQIAQELGLGARTVEWHLTRVYRKLGIRSRAQLAVVVSETPWAAWPHERAERPIGSGPDRGNTRQNSQGEEPK